MTDDQLLEFAKKWRCTHPGCAPWLDLTEDHFVKVARAIEQASRRAALEQAASAALNASLDSIWADGRLMDAREVGSACAAAIRKLAKETNNG
jgi:hypothetical protein